MCLCGSGGGSTEGRMGHIIGNGSAYGLREADLKQDEGLTLFGPRSDWVFVTVLSYFGALFPFCFPRILAILLSSPWHCSKEAHEKLLSIISHQGNANWSHHATPHSIFHLPKGLPCKHIRCRKLQMLAKYVERWEPYTLLLGIYSCLAMPETGWQFLKKLKSLYKSVLQAQV